MVEGRCDSSAILMESSNASTVNNSSVCVDGSLGGLSLLWSGQTRGSNAIAGATNGHFMQCTTGTVLVALALKFTAEWLCVFVLVVVLVHTDDGGYS